jgi:K+-transporting ATPase KdpF subunit
MRAAEGTPIMTAFYVISAIIALGLLIYLVIALLKPEWFK